MQMRAFTAAAIMAVAGLAGGCAGDAGLLTTSSIEPAASKQPKVDPYCVALMSKIDALRKEGTPGRIEKVAAGKSATAVVKRSALQRITELDKANAQFQSRCSTLTPGQRSAAQTTAKPGEAAKAAAAAAGAKQPDVKTVAKQPATTAKDVTTKAATKATQTAEKTVAKAAATTSTETATK